MLNTSPNTGKMQQKMETIYLIAFIVNVLILCFKHCELSQNWFLKCNLGVSFLCLHLVFRPEATF